MIDRLDEIKKKTITTQQFADPDRNWLISEVERLRGLLSEALEHGCYPLPRSAGATALESVHEEAGDPRRSAIRPEPAHVLAVLLHAAQESGAAEDWERFGREMEQASRATPEAPRVGGLPPAPRLGMRYIRHYGRSLDRCGMGMVVDVGLDGLALWGPICDESRLLEVQDEGGRTIWRRGP